MFVQGYLLISLIELFQLSVLVFAKESFVLEKAIVHMGEKTWHLELNIF